MLLPNAKAFYDAVRDHLFGGKLSQAQVNGLTAILNAWPEDQDARWVAYSLATAYHETGRTMEPVRETFAKTDAEARLKLKARAYARSDSETGHAYYGRGLVQLTWRTNYEEWGQELGLDLVRNPDLALALTNAAKILVGGMMKGTFTGKTLARFFNSMDDDPRNARKIINGTDRAADIAVYHQHFLDALLKAGMKSPYERKP